MRKLKSFQSKRDTKGLKGLGTNHHLGPRSFTYLSIATFLIYLIRFLKPSRILPNSHFYPPPPGFCKAMPNATGGQVSSAGYCGAECQRRTGLSTRRSVKLRRRDKLGIVPGRWRSRFSICTPKLPTCGVLGGLKRLERLGSYIPESTPVQAN